MRARCDSGDCARAVKLMSGIPWGGLGDISGERIGGDSEAGAGATDSGYINAVCPDAP